MEHDAEKACKGWLQRFGSKPATTRDRFKPLVEVASSVPRGEFARVLMSDTVAKDILNILTLEVCMISGLLRHPQPVFQLNNPSTKTNRPSESTKAYQTQNSLPKQTSSKHHQTLRKTCQQTNTKSVSTEPPTHITTTNNQQTYSTR